MLFILIVFYFKRAWNIRRRVPDEHTPTESVCNCNLFKFLITSPPLLLQTLSIEAGMNTFFLKNEEKKKCWDYTCCACKTTLIYSLYYKIPHTHKNSKSFFGFIYKFRHLVWKYPVNSRVTIHSTRVICFSIRFGFGRRVFVMHISNMTNEFSCARFSPANASSSKC